MLGEKVSMTKDAWDQCANGVEVAMVGSFLIFFSFLSYMFARSNFVNQTLGAHVLVNSGIYLPLKAVQKFQVCHSSSFCTIWKFLCQFNTWNLFMLNL